MIIIPAIDIIDGKCVRLSQGAFDRSTVYSHDPLTVAKQFEDAGLHRLHLVDLDGAKSGTVRNWDILERLVSFTSLQIDFSGGISSTEQVEQAFQLGASYLCVGSLAVRDEARVSEWLTQFGQDRFIIAADVLDEQVMVRGWTASSGVGLFNLVEQYAEKGVKKFICTDIRRDGMLNGPAVGLYQKLIHRFPVMELIASGGVGSMGDINALEKAGCAGAIIGKALYENRIQLSELC